MSAEEVGSSEMEVCTGDSSPETKEIIETETIESELVADELMSVSESDSEEVTTESETTTDEKSETPVENEYKESKDEDEGCENKGEETKTLTEDISEESGEENCQESFELVIEEGAKESEKDSKESEKVNEEGGEDKTETVAEEDGEDKTETVAEEENNKNEEDSGEMSIDQTGTVAEEENNKSETVVEGNTEDGETVDDRETVSESATGAEEETVESEAVPEDDQSNAKCSRELKALLELSKEAKLDTNINHKRKSVDPKKLFNNDNLLNSSGEENADGSDAMFVGGKRKSAYDKLAGNAKKMRKEPLLDLGLLKRGKDPFCWRCHKNVVASQQSAIGGIFCHTCPRSHHLKCIKQSWYPHWQCPDCITIVKAESTKTRSPSLRSMELDDLCTLLRFALKRMVQVADSGPFVRPVNEKECPDYRKYIVHPMDLTMIEKNIDDNVYGSTHAFEADTKWILHNSIIYNSFNSNADQSKLTSTAKYIDKICKQEMIEIENCSNCYLNANTKDSWFVEVCPKPHLLIWAKLKGFPYWPAKAMTTNRFGMVDVRFFGAHDRAWVAHKDCYLYSHRNPNMHQMKKYNINECIMEVDVYIENLKKKFGVFKYAPFKAPYDPEIDHLPLFLPKYVPPSSDKKPLQRLRSESKSSVSSVKSLSSVAKDLAKEMDTDEGHDTSQENISTDHDLSISEATEKSEPEEKTNNNVEKTEAIEESKPPDDDDDESPKQKAKITDKLFDKLVKPDEEAAVEKKEDVEKKEPPVDEKKSVEKPDYEENDLLEVLYAEEVDGSKLDRAKNSKSRINGVSTDKALITGLKDNINKALALSKNIKSMSATEKVKKSPIEEIMTITNETVKKSQENAKTEMKNMTEALSNADISIDAVARGFAKIKAINEINKAINVIRPELLSKGRRSVTDSKQITVARRSDKSEDLDWYLNDNNGEVSKKRKLSLDSYDDDDPKKHVEDEVIIIKCESKDEEEAASKKAPTAKKRLSIIARELERSEKRRELFQALKISEKGTECEKPKVHEIRTRSKTEEKIANAGFTLKQRARKSFPNVYKGKKELPLPPLITTNRMIKQMAKPPLAVNNPPSIVVSSGVTATTSTSQSLVLVPTPILFQSSQLGGPNAGQILAMVAPGSSPYTFVSQGSTFINGNINYTPLGKDKIQAGANQLNIEGRPESSTSASAECPKLAEITTTNKVPAAEVPALPNIANESSVENKGTALELVSVPLERNNWTLPKGKMVDKQQFNSSVSEPLNPTEFNILNGIVKETVPKAFLDILSRPPPLLKPRPPGPLSTQFDTGAPSTAGPWSARINSISHRLSDYLRGMLVETLNDVSSTTENPEALITTLQLEIESLKSRHAEEILEIKKNVNSLLQDIQKSIIEEKEKVIVETRSSCETETIRRVEEAKSKQWCANCMKEAQFYCCWNTSYCDYPCQTKHWPKHMSKCTQNSQSQNSAQMGLMKGSQQILLRPVMPPKGFTGGKPLLAKPTKIIMSKTTAQLPMNIVRNSPASGMTLIESRPGSYEVITNGQIIDANKIAGASLKGIRKVPTSASSMSTCNSTAKTPSKTILLQSTKSPVMSATIKSQSVEDPLAF